MAHRLTPCRGRKRSASMYKVFGIDPRDFRVHSVVVSPDFRPPKILRFEPRDLPPYIIHQLSLTRWIPCRRSIHSAIKASVAMWAAWCFPDSLSNLRPAKHSLA